MDAIEIYTRKLAAWESGHNPWVCIDNPDPQARNKAKIRVRAKDIWGDPRVGWYYAGKDKKDKGNES